MSEVAVHWNTLLPRSIFSVLGAGPANNYDIYLDTLVAIYQSMMGYTTGTGIPYEQARNIADQKVEARGADLLTPDEFVDIDLENNETVSMGAKVIRRLEKSGWLQREFDRLTRQPVILFPPYAHLLLAALDQLASGDEMDYSSMLLAILELLTQNQKLRRRDTIHQAERLMKQLRGYMQRVIQNLATFRPDAERLQSHNLNSWLVELLGSETASDYRNFKLSHSPTRWYSELLTALQQRHGELEDIALEAQSQRLTPQLFLDSRQATDEVAAKLRSMEEGLNALVQMVDEMDGLMNELHHIFNRRVQVALAQHATAALLHSSQQVMAALHERCGKGRSDVLLLAALPQFKLAAVGPTSIKWRTRVASDHSVSELIATEEQGALPKEIYNSMRRGRHPGSSEVAHHFEAIFAEREEMPIEELLSSNTREESFWVSRLLDYCTLSAEYQFHFYISLPDETDPDNLPLVHNDFKQVSRVMIRRRKKRVARR